MSLTRPRSACAASPEPVVCPQCGAAVVLGSGCSGCAGSSGCALACCPACGASFPNPRRSGLAYRLSLWLGRRRDSGAPPTADPGGAP